jgi:tetratricopeptide (TPR) repeat protein
MILLVWATPVSSQRRITFNSGCSYAGDAYRSEVNAWDSNDDARVALERIMKFTGLPQNFIIMAADVSNAQAGIYGSTRFILYNQSFIQKIKDYTNSDWSAISVLAHEIGHHLSGHTLDNQGSRPSKELEADLFSGFVLFKMGASLDDATRAVQTIGSEYGSVTHPSRTARIAAVTKGWMSSRDISLQTGTDMQQQPFTPIYRNASQNELVQKYTSYSQQGANAYNTGNYKTAFENFKNSLLVFDLLIAKGYINQQMFDSTTTLYAGISAEKANDIAAAAWYYGRIADRKSKGEGYVEIYKWLADYYKRSGNVLKALKYLALGREVYPNDNFWTGFELDITRESGNKSDLFNKYEQVIREHPNNPLFLFNYGVELYQAGYDPDITKRPSNSAELIARAVDVMFKVLAIKPDYANANMVLGQIFYNQGVEYNQINKTIRPQNGTRLTEVQIAKKEQLREQLINKFNQAQPYLTKSVNLLDVQGKLSTEDKETLKNALDLLIIVKEEMANQLEIKKRKAERSNNSLEVQKYTAELNAVNAEIANYNQSFNAVDSKH